MEGLKFEIHRMIRDNLVVWVDQETSNTIFSIEEGLDQSFIVAGPVDD